MWEENDSFARLEGVMTNVIFSNILKHYFIRRTSRHLDKGLQIRGIFWTSFSGPSNALQCPFIVLYLNDINFRHKLYKTMKRWYIKDWTEQDSHERIRGQKSMNFHANRNVLAIMLGKSKTEEKRWKCNFYDWKDWVINILGSWLTVNRKIDNPTVGEVLAAFKETKVSPRKFVYIFYGWLYSKCIQIFWDSLYIVIV